MHSPRGEERDWHGEVVHRRPPIRRPFTVGWGDGITLQLRIDLPTAAAPNPQALRPPPAETTELGPIVDLLVPANAVTTSMSGGSGVAAAPAAKGGLSLRH